MNIGYHSNFMDRIIERADKRQERMEKMINKMLDKSEPILNAGKPKPMTNEEYLKSCNTEQFAEWIASVVQKAISIKENNGIVMLESAVWWGEWLKQPHTTKE